MRDLPTLCHHGKTRIVEVVALFIQYNLFVTSESDPASHGIKGSSIKMTVHPQFTALAIQNIPYRFLYLLCYQVYFRSVISSKPGYTIPLNGKNKLMSKEENVCQSLIKYKMYKTHLGFSYFEFKI